jgi:hypothetical protein
VVCQTGSDEEYITARSYTGSADITTLGYDRPFSRNDDENQSAVIKFVD